MNGDMINLGLLVANIAVTGGVWYRLGCLGARVKAVEDGGACLKFCPAKKGS